MTTAIGFFFFKFPKFKHEDKVEVEKHFFIDKFVYKGKGGVKVGKKKQSMVGKWKCCLLQNHSFTPKYPNDKVVSVSA